MFLRKRSQNLNPVELQNRLIKAAKEEESLFAAMRSLLYVLKLFSFDIKDINSEAFEARIDKLVDILKPGDENNNWQQAYESSKKHFIAFADEEKNYIIDRETELRNIIELLRKSLIEMVGENRNFDTRIIESNSRIEQLTGLDDIRRIKEGLKSELDQVKRAIQDRQIKDTETLDVLARQVGSLKSSLDEVKETCLTDPLTGAGNRLSFDQRIRKLIEKHTLSSNPFCLLMCDIDDFKKINDNYGHQVGDAVLKVFVKLCRSLIRSDDFIARYGGEEFVIIMPYASLRIAHKRAREICFETFNKEHHINYPPVCGIVKFAVSIGVAEARRNDTVETLIGRADRALYAAKNTGKNRAVSEREAEKTLARIRPAA